VDVGLAAVGVAVYAGFAALGQRLLATRASTTREALALVALVAAAVTIQLVVPSGAPYGYGLARWVFALHAKGSSGYFRIAEKAADHPWRFLADYPVWIKDQDSLHIGTHPPGLIATEAGLLRLLEAAPGAVRFIEARMPDSVVRSF